MTTQLDPRLFEQLETSIRDDNCVALAAAITDTEEAMRGKVKTIRSAVNSSCFQHTGLVAGRLGQSTPVSAHDKTAMNAHDVFDHNSTSSYRFDYGQVISKGTSSENHLREISGRHEDRETEAVMATEGGPEPPNRPSWRGIEERNGGIEKIATSTNLAWLQANSKFCKDLKRKTVQIFGSKLGLGLWMQCIDQGSFHCVKFLLKHGVDIDSVDVGSRKTALMCAAQNGNNKMLELLLSFGAKVDIKLKHPATPPLVYAATMGHAQCVRCLLVAGAKVNKTPPYCTPPLVAAAENGSLECLTLLLGFKAEVDSCDRSGKTALMFASERGHLDCVMHLCTAGAKVNRQDALGKTALMYAATSSSECLCRLLMAGADKWKRDKERGKTAFMYAAEHGKLHCLQVLSCWSDGELHHIHHIPQEGPLISEVSGNATRHCLGNCEDIHSADVFSRKTPLMYAAQAGHVECVKFLIQTGADIDDQDITQSTALIHATSTLCNVMHYDLPSLTPQTDRHSRCVQILLGAGARATISNDHMDSAISLAFIPDNITNLRKRLYVFLPFARSQRDLLKYVKRKAAQYMGHKASVGSIFIQVMLQTESTFIFEEPQPWALIPSCFDLKVSILNGWGLSPSLSALLHKRPDIARYLVVNSVFKRPDGDAQETLSVTRQACSSNTQMNPESERLLKAMYSQPWPLVKLAFVVVSTMMNSAPMREMAIASSGLPARIQRMLGFKEVTVHLCPSQWSDLPLVFDPTEYETLPTARPLLYNWPVRRALEKCGCDMCGAKGVKYVSLDTIV